MFKGSVKYGSVMPRLIYQKCKLHVLVVADNLNTEPRDL